MPIIGTIASSISGNLTPPATIGVYESIATVTLGGGSSNIQFSSIPQTYKHLELRHISRDGDARTGGTAFWVLMNGISSSTYSAHYITSEYSGQPSSGGIGNWGQSPVGFNTWNSNAAYFAGVAVCNILNYTGTVSNKPISTIAGFDYNGYGVTAQMSGAAYGTTGAITQLNIYPGIGPFMAGSSWALYGIKG
jgi:hypothetical protein